MGLIASSRSSLSAYAAIMEIAPSESSWFFAVYRCNYGQKSSAGDVVRSIGKVLSAPVVVIDGKVCTGRGNSRIVCKSNARLNADDEMMLEAGRHRVGGGRGLRRSQSHDAGPCSLDDQFMDSKFTPGAPQLHEPAHLFAQSSDFGHLVYALSPTFWGLSGVHKANL